jgi:hypothetical protein
MQIFVGWVERMVNPKVLDSRDESPLDVDVTDELSGVTSVEAALRKHSVATTTTVAADRATVALDAGTA